MRKHGHAVLMLVLCVACHRQPASPPATFPDPLAAGSTCEAQKAHWIDAHGWQSPVSAYNHAVSWPVTRAEVRWVLDREFLTEPFLALPQKLFLRAENGDLNEYRRFAFAAALAGLGRNERTHRLSEHIASFLQSRRPGELLVVWARARLGYDAFNRHFDPLRGAAFTHPRLKEDSQFFSEGYYHFLELVTGHVKRRQKGSDISSLVHVGPLLPIARNQEDGIHVPPVETQLGEEKPASLDRIVLLDVENLRESSPIDDLPSAQCLRQLGYEKIRVAIEEKEFGEPVSEEELMEIRGARAILTRAKTDSMAELRYGRLASPAALAVVEKENTDVHPLLGALIDRFAASANVLPVSYEGLE